VPFILSENSSGGNFTPAPAGAHQAVCVDVVDLGMVETEWQGVKKMKPMLRLTWEIDEHMEDGRPFIASRRFTASLHEKSGLRHFLEAWRGRPFTPDELAGFDLEKLLGANCILNIVHKTNGSDTYANVTSVTPLMGRMSKLEPSGTFVRKQDRPGYVPPASAQDDDLAPGPEPADDQFPTDDDIPF